MYKFVYPYKLIKQLGLDNKEIVIKNLSGTGHMIIGDTNMTLCGTTEEELAKGMNGIISRDVRFNNVPICPDCQEKWKSLPGSPWRKWVGNGN